MPRRNDRPRTGRVRWPGWVRRWPRSTPEPALLHHRRWPFRALAGALLSAVAVSGLLVAESAPASALPRGEAVTFPGGLTISNYVMPNGKRAYCIEIQFGEPSGYISEAGRVSVLPGRPGQLTAWGDPAGMRQMNYLIDQHGQNRDAWSAAAVQLTIWRMRENFRSGNPFLNSRIAILESSAQGRALISASDVLMRDARQKAQAPGAPKAVTGKLSVTDDPGGKDGRYRVAYPAGTTELSVTGGAFVRNGGTSLSVSGSGASARYVDAAPDATRIVVNGAWRAVGSRGWDSRLDIYNTSTASGAVGQRLAVALGDSSGKELRGRFNAVTKTLPPPFADPIAVTQAQPSADVGGTMSDALTVSEAPGTRARLWPEAVAEFTAYLEPAAGAPKFDANWEPVLGESELLPALDPETGEPLWRETTGPDGESVREPVLEERRDPLRWTEKELEAMSAAERCVAQPVYREGGIGIARLGEYRTQPVPVRSPGTVNWVERIESRGATVHEGTCGVPNERTVTEQPGVVTAAQPSAMIGELVTDTASVTGSFAPGASYSVTFEAYRAEESADGVPLCTAQNRVYRSKSMPVAGPGDIVAPGFIAQWEHGTRIWWVETLSMDTGNGTQRLHRGACGLETETSEIGRPEVATVAQETAVVGDRISDTAVVTGDLTETEHARWELTFSGYRGPAPDPETGTPRLLDPEVTAPPLIVPGVARTTQGTEGDAERPQCSPENLLFETGATPVTGLGEYRSEDVTVPPEWAGTVWWVETLWLIEGEQRTAVSRGSCGAVQESTVVTVPEVTTLASTVVATGEAMRDVAQVSGQLSEREGTVHDLVFEGYRGAAAQTGTSAAQCTPENALFVTDPVTVTGPGEVVSPEFTALPEYGETVWWVAVLRLHADGATTELTRGQCGAPEETTTVQPPTVRTESAGDVMVGDEMFDTAVVGGRLADRAEVSYLVRFTAFAVQSDGVLRCQPEDIIADLSDSAGVVVTGPGRYTSRSVTTTAEHVGIGGYVETLVLREGDAEHVIAEGACGATNESFSVAAEPGTPGPPEPLARTGSGGLGLAVLLGSALVVAALAAAGIGFARRRREEHK